MDNGETEYSTHSALVLSEGTTQHLGSGGIIGDFGRPLPTSDPLLGLNRLQLSRNAWLNGSAIDVPAQFRYESLPAETQALINLMNTAESYGLFNDVNKGAAGLQQFNIIMKVNMYQDADLRESYARIRRTEYTIIPINTGGHWQTVVLHMRQSSPESEDYDQVAQIAVVDGYNHKPTTNFVLSRLEKLLDQCGISFQSDCVRNVQIPAQEDLYSCGLRSYVVMTVMMKRIAHLHVNGLRYHEALWEPLDAWFNAHETRMEMAGLCAVMVVQQQHYRARIAVEIVHEVRMPDEANVKNPGSLVPAEGLAPKRRLAAGTKSSSALGSKSGGGAVKKTARKSRRRRNDLVQMLSKL